MRMPLFALLFLVFILAGCEAGNGETEIGIYDLGALDQEEVIDALNALDGEDMPLRASASGSSQVLVTAPPRVHRQLPGLLDSMTGSERAPTLLDQRISVSLWLLSTRDGGDHESPTLPADMADQLRDVLAGRYHANEPLALIDELHFEMSGRGWSSAHSQRLRANMNAAAATQDRMVLNGTLDMPGEAHQNINIALSPGDTVVLRQRRDRDDPNVSQFVVLRADIQ